MTDMIMGLEPNLGIAVLLVVTTLVGITWVVTRIRKLRPAAKPGQRTRKEARQSNTEAPPRRLMVGQLAAGGARVPDIARRTGLAQDAVRLLLAS